jgi:TolB-like protein
MYQPTSSKFSQSIFTIAVAQLPAPNTAYLGESIMSLIILSVSKIHKIKVFNPATCHSDLKFGTGFELLTKRNLKTLEL